MSISCAAAMELLTPGEKEYGRQYYKQDSSSYVARMSADLSRYDSTTVTDIVTAHAIELALAADLQ